MREDVNAGAAHGALEARAARMFADVLAATHLSRPGDLSAVLACHARVIGVEQLVVYLIDYEQAQLVPVPGPDSSDRSVLRVQGTVGGRAFATVQVQESDAGTPGRRRLWFPLLDGTARIGALEVVIPAEGGVDRALVRYASATPTWPPNWSSAKGCTATSSSWYGAANPCPSPPSCNGTSSPR